MNRLFVCLLGVLLVAYVLYQWDWGRPRLRAREAEVDAALIEIAKAQTMLSGADCSTLKAETAFVAQLEQRDRKRRSDPQDFDFEESLAASFAENRATHDRILKKIKLAAEKLDVVLAQKAKKIERCSAPS
jgi:hypothetical protein